MVIWAFVLDDLVQRDFSDFDDNDDEDGKVKMLNLGNTSITMHKSSSVIILGPKF